MALIKTDPSQTKTVIALLAVLVIAGIATVARIKPQDTPQAATQAGAASAQTSPVEAASGWRRDPDRNPFAKPQLVKIAINETKTKTNDLLGGVRSALEPGANHFNINESSTPAPGIGPMDISPMVQVRPSNPDSSVQSKAETAKPAEPEKPKLTFTLLATVKNRQGLCAVIRTGEEKVDVVEIGDRLGSGFTVKKLETDFAVLTNGRDTVIVKRPQS